MRRKSFSNIYKSLLGGTLLAVLATGCNTEDFTSPSTDERDAVIITAGAALSADAESMTRATIENIWEADDHIGISMLTTSIPQTVVNSYQNRDYVINNVSGTIGTFISNPESSKMYYPVNGTDVTFKAYYPHNSSIVDHIYPVDVSGQGNIAELDLMTAEHQNREGELNQNNKNNPKAHLEFHHRLTLITFNLNAETPISLNGSMLKVKGMLTKGTYNLINDVWEDKDATSVQDITIHPIDNKGQAILLPREAGEGVTFVVTTANNVDYTATMDPALELKGGYHYTFNLTLKTTPAEISATIEPWLGGPVNSRNVVRMVTDLGENENVKDNAQIQLYLKDTKTSTGDDVADPEFAPKSTYTYNKASDVWTASTPLYWENIYGNPVEFRGTSVWEPKLNETQMDDILISDDVSVEPYKGVNLNMKHAGSKVSITLTSTDKTFSADVLKAATVSLPAYINRGTLNATTGAFEIDDSSTGNINPEGEGRVAIFPPQTIAEGDVIARVTINGIDYDVKAESGGFLFNPGTHYQLILNVQKTDVEISAKIVDWVTQDLGTKEVRIGEATLGTNDGVLPNDKLYLFIGDDTNRSPVAGYFEYTGSEWVHKNALGTNEPLYWENIPNTGSIYASITRDEITPGNKQSKDYITATPIINNGGAGNTALHFEMSHKVAKVQIKLTSDVYTAEELKAAEITLPAYMTGDHLVNGIYEPGSISDDIKLADPNNITVTTSAYLQPQTITSPKTLVKVKIKGREYLIHHTVTYTPGQITYLNIDIKASEAKVSVSVKPWDHQDPVDIRFFFTESETSVRGFENGDQIRFYKMGNPISSGVTDDKNKATYAISGSVASLANWEKKWYRDDFQPGDQFVGVFPATAPELSSGNKTFDWTCKGDNTGTIVTNAHQDDVLVSRLSGSGSTGTVVAGSANVALDFIHVLSKITVEIYPEEGFTYTELYDAAHAGTPTLYPELRGFKMGGTVDVTTAVATPTSAPITFRPTKLGSNPVDAVASYEALIMPQTITAANIIDVKYDGQTYPALFNSAGSSVATTFEAGKNHVFKIYLKKTGILLSTSVAPWAPGTGGSITIQ